MKVVAGLLLVVGFIASGLAATAPWLTEITHTTGGTTNTYKVGFTLQDAASADADKFKAHMNFCSRIPAKYGDLSGCSDVQYSLLGLSIAYMVAAVLTLVSGIMCFIGKPIVALFLAPLALTLQLGAGFGFQYRVIPLFKELFTTNAASSVDYSYTWVTFVGIGGVGVTWLGCLVVAFGLRRMLEAIAEQQAKKLEEDAAAAEAAANEPTAEQAAAAADPQQQQPQQAATIN